MPEIRLDKGETVVGNAVYSAKMINPFTGTSFSQEAQKILKQKRNRDDEISKNTNLFLDASLQRLADLQEWIKPEALATNAFQFGTTNLAAFAPGLPPPDRKAQQKRQKERQQFWNQSPAIHLPQPLPTYYLPEVEITAQQPIPTATLPQVTITAKKKQPAATKSRSTQTTATQTTTTQTTQAAAAQPTIPLAVLPPVPTTTGGQQTASAPRSPAPPAAPAAPAPSPAGTTGTGTGDGSLVPKKGATAGDWLQAATIASRFLNLLEGPAQLTPALDDTHIRENLIDDTSVINRIKRLSALRNRSVAPNSRAISAAVANASYAAAIQAESDARNQIAQANAARRAQVDLQRSAQRRYNASVINQTRQYNQAARDAHRMAMDNAFDSLGYLGQAMNERDQAYEILNLYRKVYPHAFK